MKKESTRINKKIYNSRSASCKKDGIQIGTETYLNTYDYDVKNIINLPIKEVKYNDLKTTSEENKDDKHFLEYFEEQKKVFIENLKYLDILYGDWWTLNNKNNFYFITVSTPYIYSLTSKHEIKAIIRKAFEYYFEHSNSRLVFKKIIKNGKRTQYYQLKEVYTNIKSTFDLIDEFVEENFDKNNKIINFYIDILKKINETNIKLDKVLFNIEKTSNKKIKDFSIYDMNVIIPFHLNINYAELFNEILERINNKDIDNKNEIAIYEEDYVINYVKNLNKEDIDFLETFKDKLYGKDNFIIKRKTILRKKKKSKI